MVELNARNANYSVRTRSQRRAALSSLIGQLERVRDAEMKCLVNTPCSQFFTISHYLGINATEAIDTAVDCLKKAYEENTRIHEALMSDRSHLF